MKLDADEIREIATSLAPMVADILEERLSETPQWAKSIPEAASWAEIEEHVLRDAIADGRLPCIRVGRSIRILRSSLFAVKNGGDS